MLFRSIEDFVGPEGKLVTEEGQFILKLVEPQKRKNLIIYADNQTRKYTFDSKDKKYEKVKYRKGFESAQDRKSTRLNSSHIPLSRMPSSA